MAEKHILLANADSHAVAELKAALGAPWTVTHAPDGPAALAAVETQRFDVLVIDLDLFTGVDAAFLNVIQKTDPQTVRLVLAAEADRSRVMKDVPGQHQFIAKPCSVTELKSIIERTLALDIWSANDDIRKLVSQVRALPPMPSLYLEIQTALQTNDVTTERVSAIIARDMAMTTKLLQVLNSAGFGLCRKIHDLNEAVGILGFLTVKSMVITIKLMSEFDHIKPVYFSIDRLWRRSTAVARMARELTLLHTGDHALAEAAFAAGLLHDVGEAVLAATFDEQFQAVQLVAREEQAPLWEVEKKNFGASHGELGAYLLGLWGMPLDLLEAAAMHDHPSRCANKQFAPVTAVHIAHVGENELNPENNGSLAPQLDTDYLTQLGLLKRLAEWRKSMALPPSTKPVPAPRKKVARKTSPAPPTQPDSVPVSKASNGWLLATGFAILVLVAWFGFGPAQRVAARWQNNSVPANIRPPATGIPDEAAGTVNQASKLPQAPARPGATAPAADTTQPSLPQVTFPELKLQGVFYSSNNPSAIINGRLIRLNAEIEGARVVQITHSSVTLEYQHQLTKLSL